MKTFGIHANLSKPEVRETVPELLSWFETHKVQVFMEQTLKEYTQTQTQNIHIVDKQVLFDESDILVVLGGDGTMLSAARQIVMSETPLLGVNLGHLGFLASVSPDQLFTRLTSVIEDQYCVEKRMALQIEVSNSETHNKYYAFNDLIIDRGGISRLIQLKVEVDGEYFNTYNADGIIIATPTGSTAYSMSAGGPIVIPTLQSIVLTPICPHSLGARPMLLPATSQIVVQVSSSDPPASISIDGQTTFRISPQSKVMIQKADHVVNIITFSDQTFFDVLRKKLQWGERPRF